jgi:hypothetical protein
VGGRDSCRMRSGMSLVQSTLHPHQLYPNSVWRLPLLQCNTWNIFTNCSLLSWNVTLTGHPLFYLAMVSHPKSYPSCYPPNSPGTSPQLQGKVGENILCLLHTAIMLQALCLATILFQFARSYLDFFFKYITCFLCCFHSYNNFPSSQGDESVVTSDQPWKTLGVRM